MTREAMAMRVRTLFPLVLALLGACAHVPTSLPPSANRKVVLISYDGVGVDRLDAMERSGVLSDRGILRMKREGIWAERLIPVNPTLTAPAHIAMATGRSPDETGIVSNTFHPPSLPLEKSESGFTYPIEAETLWESARRQGKRVGVMTFPGTDATSSRRTGDWGMIYVEPTAKPKIVEVTSADFNAISDPPDDLPKSFSEVLAATIDWSFVIEAKQAPAFFQVIAIDSTDDSTTNYDRLVARSEGKEHSLQPGIWFPLTTNVTVENGSSLFGSWSTTLEYNPGLLQARLYVGAVCHNVGYPAEYVAMIDREAGFWPGPPDDTHAKLWIAGKGGMPANLFSEQLARFSEFFTQATLVSIRKMPFDLIIGYQPIIDEAEHQFRIENNRQQWSTPEIQETARGVRSHAFRTLDRSVETLLDAVDHETTFIATSDHGLSAVDTVVNLARVLSTSSIARDPIQWRAYTSGNLAHIYASRQPSQVERDAIVENLRNLEAPDHAPVFEKVFIRSTTNHPNSGEIIAYTYPRFGLSTRPDGPLFAKTEYFGQHGGLNHHRELHTIFGALGGGVPKRTLRAMNQTSIAGFVSQLLGIRPPSAHIPVMP